MSNLKRVIICHLHDSYIQATVRKDINLHKTVCNQEVAKLARMLNLFDMGQVPQDVCTGSINLTYRDSSVRGWLFNLIRLKKIFPTVDFQICESCARGLGVSEKDIIFALMQLEERSRRAFLSP